MFQQFKLLFIDDLLDAKLSGLLTEAIGSSGIYADWQAIDSGTAAIREFKDGNIPDLALIDMMLGGREDENCTGKDPTTRGLFVATALRHYSDVHKKRTNFIIYTAQPKVKEELSFLLELPPELVAGGVKPLLTIIPKANPDDVHTVLTWAKAELRVLAGKQIKERGVPPYYVEQVQSSLTGLDQVWSRFEQSLTTDFEQSVRSEIVRLVAWWAKNQDAGGYLDVQTLKDADARDVTAVEYALRTSIGSDIEKQSQPLTEAIKRFRERHRDTLKNTVQEVNTITNRLCKSDVFESLKALFPFQAQLLLGADKEFSVGNPTLLITAFREMLELLTEADHHYSLFRLLKSINDESPRLFLTRFAHAAHELKDRLDDQRGPSFEERLKHFKRNSEDREFEEQVLYGEVQGRIPPDTILRMESDGEHFQKHVGNIKPWGSLIKEKLTWFALRYGADPGVDMDHPRQEWHDTWRKRLSELGVLGEGDVIYDTDSGQEPDFLSDWRAFFGDPEAAAADTALLSKLVVFFKDRRPRARLHYQRDGYVEVELRWPDLSLPSTILEQFYTSCEDVSPLTKLLCHLSRWGTLQVSVKLDEESRVARFYFRSGKRPDYIPAVSHTPGLVVKIVLMNYALKRRSGNETALT